MEKLKWHNEKRKVNDLIPYEQNPRKMSEQEVENLKESIDRFNLVEIPAIDLDNKIIAGHQRMKILQMIGRGNEEIDVRVSNRKLTDDEFREYLLRSNKNTGSWDFDILANFDGAELLNVGFEQDEINSIFDLVVEPDEKDDEVPEVPEVPTSKLGDIYELGQNRVMCGDATSIDDIKTLMQGKRADLCFTDPPYGMNAVSKSGVLKKTYGTDIVGDDSIEVAVDSFNVLYSMKIPTMVFWGANYYANKLPNSCCWIVWDKNNGGSDQMDCELAWTNLKGVTRQYTQASEKTNRLHPTQKPVELMEWCIKRLNIKPQIVLDVFLGSGSTLIACEKTNRTCYGMELDPKYVDVIIKRWEDYTGEKAELLTK
jgi:DNA modification methylase